MAEHGNEGAELVLTDEEGKQLTALARDLADRGAERSHDFYRQAPVLAQDLPAALRTALTAMRQQESPAYAVIRGLAVDDAEIGDTPDRWGDDLARRRTAPYAILLTLVGSLVGEAFGWESQQGGAVVHDVLPLREYENTQINFASREPIWWHTEDAFHAYRPDYVGLLCLRNPQNAATTVSCAVDWDVSDPRFDVLFDRRFQQSPDTSHGGVAQVRPPQAILFGERDRPYVCVDPYFLQDPADDRVSAVLREFAGIVDAALREVVLQPGDIVLVDNYRAVHGRKPFVAGYDGRDRWLKRLSVSRNLRHAWPAWTAQSRQVLTGEHRSVPA